MHVLSHQWLASTVGNCPPAWIPTFAAPRSATTAAIVPVQRPEKLAELGAPPRPQARGVGERLQPSDLGNDEARQRGEESKDGTQHNQNDAAPLPVGLLQR